MFTQSNRTISPMTDRPGVNRPGVRRSVLTAAYAMVLACAALALLLHAGHANALGVGSEELVNKAAVPARIPAGARRYEPASVLAQPGLNCTLQSAKNQDRTMVLRVMTDHDGYARFHAVRATGVDAVQQLVLDCADAAGHQSSYSVDLTADKTFTARPLDLAGEPGVDRPALLGDPMSYSQSQLLVAGYGLRPDPTRSPAAYARWFTSASKPARLLQMKRPLTRAHTAVSAGVTSTVAPYWVGSVLTGAPLYESVEMIFNVPTAIAGGDQTTSTEMAIWNGLGGYNQDSSLIQGGVSVQTTPSAAGYGVFREYCCGDPDSNGYGGAFAPNPGDQFYSEEWYCDSTGNINAYGGYGCSFLHDITAGAILSCISATGSPCWSVKALPLCSVNPNAPNCMTPGLTAEFIIENQSLDISATTSAFTDFTPTVTMAGSAYTSATNSSSQSISTDSAVDLLTDFTDTTTRMNVSLGTTDQTYFAVQGMTNSIWEYTGNGWTALDDNPASTALAAAADNLYQLHVDGSIWKSTGAPCGASFCGGWVKYDDNTTTVAIAAGGTHLYQLHGSGSIWKSTGAPCDSSGCTGWRKLDQNPAAIAIAAAGKNLYELRSDGEILMSTGAACSNNICAGWVELDNNPLAVAIAADANNLYELHSSGQVWKYTGAPCTGTYCPGWTRLDSNAATVAITSGGGHVYEYRNDGEIWKWKGAACTSSSCWVQLDNNPLTTSVVADGANLYELHNTGSVWKSTGVACSGGSCPGWSRVDSNPMTNKIAAGGARLYELHGN
jgi:hypothetical protein